MTSRQGIQQRSTPADDKAPCYQPHGQSNQIRGRTDRNTMNVRAASVAPGPAGRLALPQVREKERWEVDLNPPKTGSADKNVETNGWLCGDRPQHAPDGHHDREGPRPITRKRLVGRATTNLPRPTQASWVGTSGLAPPSGVGKAGAARWEIAVPTTRVGGQGPRKDATSEAPAMEEEDGGQRGVWARPG